MKTQTVPASPAKSRPAMANVHNKVAIPTFVGAVVSLALIAGKSHGVDLGDTGGLLTTVVMGVVGWMVPGE